MKERLLIVTLHFIFKVPWEPRWKRSCILIEFISFRPICLLPSFNLQHVLPYARRKLKNDCCKIVQTSCFAKFEYLNWLNKVTFGNLRIKTHGYLACVQDVVNPELGCHLHGHSRMKAHRVSCSENLSVSPSPTNQLSNRQHEARIICFFLFFLQCTTWRF